MSVGPISGSGNPDVAALQKQLQVDQRQLEADQAGGASDQQVAMDQTRIQLDNAAITSAEAASAQRAQGGLGAAVDMYL